MKSLNILVADDQPIFVEGLRTLLAGPGDAFVCRLRGVANTGTQVVELLRAYDTDLLLLDLNLPDSDGLKILPSLKKGFSNTRVLIMTMSDDPRLVKAAFKAGADGYMLKTGSKDELFMAIKTVIEGQTFLGQGVAATDRMRGHVGGSPAMLEERFARKHGLTPREMEVMRLIGHALSNKEISGKLFISDQTVSVHRKNIMRKLSVNNTATLIKIAFENNLV